VTRRGVDVKARKGYWALTEEEARRAEVVTPAPPSDIARAFATLATSRTGRPIDARIETARSETASGLARVTFAWESRGTRDRAAASTPALVKLTAFDATGATRFDGEAPASPPAAFDLPPGRAKLKIDVLNASGESIDLEMRDIEVPDLWTPAVALSSPRVVRARDGRHYLALVGDAHAPGAASREFRRTDRLLIRFSAYARDGVTPEVIARLVSKTGDALATLAAARSTLEGATHQIDLPLANLASGDFVLRIEAKAGDATAVELVPLRVQ
jgi:hypothetical protein